MSVAVCRSPAAGFESILMLDMARDALPTALSPSNTWLPPTPPPKEPAVNKDEEEEKPPGQFDIWSSIQADKSQQQAAQEAPYVHPLVGRSSSLLSQKSLEICTESLGSETGSDDFFDESDFFSLLSSPKKEAAEQAQQQTQDEEEQEEEADEVVRNNNKRKELATVHYHCSISRRSSLPRSFPPPLPSISRRDGPCLQMRPHRRDGRLVVQAVTVPSQNYLHAERQGGRLLLSFINTTTSHQSCKPNDEEAPQDEEEQLEQEEAEEIEDEEVEEEEEEEEEEVEVVDRGTVVEVKVSTQPQQQSGVMAMKVHRSSIVINKFVSCMPLISDQTDQYLSDSKEDYAIAASATPPMRRLSPTTTTAAVAAVAASSVSALSADGSHSSSDNKLLFTSKRRNREELLHDMRRCSQLRKPLFIWEPCCIATSS